MADIIGTICTFAAAALAFLFGILYLIKRKFMSYHRKAVQKEWVELSPEVRTLILALMRAASGGFLSVSLVLAVLQIRFIHSHEHSIALTILAAGSILALGSLYAMLLVRTRTKGRPPIVPVAVIFILLIAGYFFNILG
ncbi:MAG TPA: hypothetical protein PKI34_10770 [Bacteroidales bacterium]|nr:hypothetical protein [Bacteroidales bacterium]